METCLIIITCSSVGLSFDIAVRVMSLIRKNTGEAVLKMNLAVRRKDKKVKLSLCLT
jgi:hypothetical protein